MVQNKCRFFIWLLLQLKLPTADRIIKRGGQTNPICPLCRTTAESHIHMFANCTYTTAVWQRIAQWSDLQIPPQNAVSMRRWWRSVTRAAAVNQDENMQVIIYTIWNVWKERCRRVFQNKAINYDQLVQITQQDIIAYREADNVVE